MKVSVLMPIYNTKEEYLRTAIESILNQTYKDYEFLIYDDASNIDLQSIVMSYNDERIHTVKMKNFQEISTLDFITSIVMNLNIKEFVIKIIK